MLFTEYFLLCVKIKLYLKYSIFFIKFKIYNRTYYKKCILTFENYQKKKPTFNENNIMYVN